jgi:hypothetical protein
MTQLMTRTAATRGSRLIGGRDAGQTGGGDPGGTGGGDPGGTGGGDPGGTGGGDPGGTGGGDPGGTGGGDPGGTGGGDPGGTGGGDPGGTGGSYVRTAFYAPMSKPVTALGPSVIAQKRIRFRIQQQELSEWCWAAVAVSVERYYDRASTLEQCDVANKVLPEQYPAVPLPKSDSACCCQCCCDPDSCNKPAELETALKKIHKWRATLVRSLAPDESIVSPGTLTFEEVRREIDRGRPVCVGITWKSGGGHFLVVRGYRLLSSGARQVYVADPLNPSALVDFDEFTLAYFGDGEWTETDLVRNDWD